MPADFPQLSQLVARASGRAVALNKSIVGEAVFTHESGIHVDGLSKNPLNYQGFDPVEVGREHRVVLGKHSGSRAVRNAYAGLGIPLTDAQAQGILLRIREHATVTKRAPDGEELRLFYLDSRDGRRRAFLRAANGTMANTLETLGTLSAAEEFFEHLGIPYDPAVIRVNRLHILKRFNQYLRTTKPEVAGLEAGKRSSRPAENC